MLLNRVKGDIQLQQFERKAGGRNIDIEHLRDDRRPAVDEVDPTIHDQQRLARLRRPRLFEEYKVSAIVEFPRDAVSWEDCGVREGRSRAVLPNPVAFTTIEPGGSLVKWRSAAAGSGVTA